MSSHIRIATRKSPLALWQAEYVKSELLRHHQQLSVDIVGFKTRGDKILDTSLSKIGGKGLFVKELEHALLAGDADIAVHSMKDVPMDFPEGLTLGPICQREDPRDAFVSNAFPSLDKLPQRARVGSSSLRRQCQIKAYRPDLQVSDLRGNVQTRLGKLDNGDFDAIILATAGLLRLGMEERITERLPQTICLPAGGQGAVGIELRTDDDSASKLLGPLNHQPTALCVRAERALNRHLNGGCQVPIACFAQLEEKPATEQAADIYLKGLVGSVDGDTILQAEARASAEDPESLGIEIAEQLLQQGADTILAGIYGNE